VKMGNPARRLIGTVLMITPIAMMRKLHMAKRAPTKPAKPAKDPRPMWDRGTPRPAPKPVNKPK
jgi:hypothetical protein